MILILPMRKWKQEPGSMHEWEVQKEEGRGEDMVTRLGSTIRKKAQEDSTL